MANNIQLPDLLRLIRRDPEGYLEEFTKQYSHFASYVEVLEDNPSQFTKPVCELVVFLSQVSHLYKKELAEFPKRLISLLRCHYSVLHPELRVSFCRALILMRKKDLLPAKDLLELFFLLFRCQDKLLRKLLFNHIVSDIKTMNAKHKNNVLNRTLQNFMYAMLKDPHAIAAKMSLDVMVELYKKHVWRDAKTVNVIVTACLSPTAKLLATAVRFFLGVDDVDSDDDSSSDEEDAPSARKLILASGVAKKTQKRRKKLEKQLAKVNKLKKRKKKGKDSVPNFSALHLIHDPQELAEQLFKRLERENHTFELRLSVLTLIGRLVGVHQLILYNFYPYILRFLKPQQRDVTRLLMITAQAVHEQVPADVVEPVLRGIADNFITERNANEVMAVGLNAAREVYTRCPQAMGDGTLLRDFVQYKTHRDRGVSTAARSLLQLGRTFNANLLNRKDRGKPGVDRDVDSDTDDEVAEDEDEADADMDEEEGVDGADDDGDDMEEDSDDGDEEDEDEMEEENDDEEEDEAGVASGDNEDEGDSDDDNGPNEIVSLEDIAMVNVKRRRNREERLASVLAGREGRAKYGARRPKMNPHASTTHKEKRKSKNFMMLRQKMRYSRSQRSFRDKQIAMRKAMQKNKRGTK
ncbi:protein SDA1 homolog [Sycon ciliatum]|uniref:protein SDA1 homolog n=1 Tax=Sycon ciliatum TaxID=27933 RepID=UPI0020AD51C3|eukprot:scpid60269/ scgid18155/ Protein SDA1 homolog; Nucleolar protein 130; SDA1 domain-containing protein 1